ncbi:MAG: C40 family peptidase [Raineya sp.]
MFAISILDIVPMRGEASDRAEQVSQLRFGEVCTILEISENQKWTKIRTFLDGYEAWVDTLQLKTVSQTYYEQYIAHIYQHKVVSNIHAVCFALDEKNKFSQGTFLSKGAILPFFSIKKDKNLLKPRDTYFFEIDAMQYRFRGDIFKNECNWQELIARALAYRNIPYLWGGRSFWGADCSGFVQEVFKSAGIFLPRDAYQQVEIGENIEFEHLQSGDLAFFQREGRVIHVGIVWLKNKKKHIVHARGFVRVDILDNTGIWDEKAQSYSHYNHSFKRIKLQNTQA